MTQIAHDHKAPAHGHDHGHSHAHGSHGHDSHGHHDPNLAHHFDSLAQQFDSAKLGIWLFLATEVLFFGGLFVAYAILRMRFPEVFSYASHYLDTIMGGINTCVLIISSLTMALAVRYAQTDNRKGLITCLVLTFLGAVGFLVIKYFEYSHKFHDNLVWGPKFYVPPHSAEGDLEAAVLKTAPAAPGTAITVENPAPWQVPDLAKKPAVDASAVKAASQGPSGIARANGTPAPAPAAEPAPDAKDQAHPGTHLEDASMPPNTHLFFAIYYAMTGLHGIHVVAGMGILAWLTWRAVRGDFSSKNFTAVDTGGLYWHIVDLIWIFLFPLFYLIH
ncbi:MAG: cytochrome c oxidase subunit 3 family protein [Planctomycetota bacterium]